MALASAPKDWTGLEAIAAWAARRLPHAPLEPEPRTNLHQALREVEIGSWEWDLRTGELDWDDATMRIFGFDQQDSIPHLERWMDTVHPDDLPRVLAEVDEAVHTQTLYNLEYRLTPRRSGGVRWVQGRARVLPDDDGVPTRMVGTIWDSTHSRIIRDEVGRALRHMSDGFVMVDAATWHPTFANATAQTWLGADLINHVVWDLPLFEYLPELEAACRRITPATLTFRAGERWYHLRLVPVPEQHALTLYISDITERHQRDAERAAARRAEAERAAQTRRLTIELAGATTSREVIDAAAQCVAAPVGADGLIVLTVDNDALNGDGIHLAGSMGYPILTLDHLITHPPHALVTTTWHKMTCC